MVHVHVTVCSPGHRLPGSQRGGGPGRHSRLVEGFKPMHAFLAYTYINYTYSTIVLAVYVNQNS